MRKEPNPRPDSSFRRTTTGIPFEQKHRILKEVYRHYTDFKDYAANTGNYFITHGPITLSFLDLQYGLDELSKRKKEAFLLNVIHDMKQKDAAAIMGITTVSVGQYVEQAVIQLAERYFSEMSEEEQEAYAQIFDEQRDSEPPEGE